MKDREIKKKEGIRLIFMNKEFQKCEGVKEKERKKSDWFTKKIISSQLSSLCPKHQTALF